nr:cysteine hydrolase [Streptococcus anginosus]
PKRRYSACVGTDLDLTLRELGREVLIVVGFDTNICVLHTLASAYYLGYRTIVPADATASFLVGTQDGGLEYFSRVFDSRVVTTAQVLTELQG